MVDELLDMYRGGAITGYQVVVDCLQMLDPKNPEPVLGHLPAEVLEDMWNYTCRYDPARMRSSDGVLPGIDQVKAAQKWIEDRSRQSTRQNLAS